MEKFYNSDWNPEMFRKWIKHLSFAENLNLVKKVWDTKLEVISAFLLVLDNNKELIKYPWEQIELIPLEQLKDYSYE